MLHGPLVYDSSYWRFSCMFSLNSVTKIFAIKRVRTCHLLCKSPGCYHSSVPARHMWETGSLNWAQFMLQWFIRLPEFTEFTESSAPFTKNSGNYRVELVANSIYHSAHFTCSTGPHLTKLISFIKCASNLSCRSHISSGGQLCFVFKHESLIFLTTNGMKKSQSKFKWII